MDDGSSAAEGVLGGTLPLSTSKGNSVEPNSEQREYEGS